MPEMGESVTEGTVLEWHVSEGDSISEGDTIVEISTDKVDAEVPAPASGTVTKIMAQPDETVNVGQEIAEIDPNGAPSGDAGANGGGEQAAATEEAEEKPAEEPAGGDGDAESGKATTDDASVSAGKSLEGGGLEIVMPEMGESVNEGTVLEWHVSEGDSVEEGQTVVEVSTDKVDAEVPAPASGTITKLLVDVDDEVKVGAPLAEVMPGEGGGTQAPRAEEGAEEPEAEAPAAAGDGARVTPVARRIAAERGVDLSKVNGSGAGGKVTKEDVLAAADGKGDGAASAAPPAPAA